MFYTLKWKITLPMLIVLLLSMLITTLTGYFSTKNTIDQMVNNVLDGGLDMIIDEVARAKRTDAVVIEEIDRKNIALANAFSEKISIMARGNVLNLNDHTIFQNIANLLGIHELNVVNANRQIVGSNFDDYYGYVYPENTAYVRILADPNYIVIEAPREDEISGNIMLYYGVRRTDAPGFIQIGFEADAVRAFRDNLDISHVAAGLRIGLTGRASILQNGVIVYSQKAEIMGNDVRSEDWYAQVSSGRGKAWIDLNGEKMYAGYAEIDDYIFLVLFPNDEYNAYLFSVIWIGITGLVVLFTAIFLLLHLANKISKPIGFLTSALDDTAHGDLTKRLPEKGKDEIAQASLSYNKTMEELRKMINIIKSQAGNLSNVGSDLASNMNQTASAVNEITANVQSIKGRVINQSASVSETHATMEQVVVNINKLNGHVENQSDNVSQASSAIEEMVANTRSVTETLIKNSSNVQILKDASEVGRNGLSEVAADIQEIARESEGLMEINSVMENIASQTNLLSMNAAIEAAHAGEAGKGFAVVADEIRKLAESSSEQSKTIGSVLGKIKGSIDKITRSTETVLKNFEDIDSSVKVVSEQNENIRSAMEEQGQGSKQILEGVGNVNEITRQVKSGAQEMLEGAKEVINESENLEKVTQEITSGMNEMAAGAEQINVAVSHVNELSGKNREGIDVLIKEVSRFKVS